jgi:hypothetical protein
MRSLSLSFAVLLSVFAAVPLGYAQSLDPKNPAPLGPGINKGYIDLLTAVHYYYFFAGPGRVDVKLAFKGRRMPGTTSKEVLTFDFYQDGALISRNPVVSIDNLERIQNHGNWPSRHKVLLYVIPQNPIVWIGGYYEIEVTGAAEFGTAAATGADLKSDVIPKAQPGPIASFAVSLSAVFFVVAAALVVPVSIVLLTLYRRAVSRSMHARTNAPGREELPARSRQFNRPADDRRDPTLANVGADAAYSRLVRMPIRAAAIYAIAQTSFAVLVATAVLTNQSGFLSYTDPVLLRFLFWALICAWPGVLTFNLVAGTPPSTKSWIVASYFAILILVRAIDFASMTNAPWRYFAFSWLVFDLPPTLFTYAARNRRIRAVGPLVLTFMMAGVLGVVVLNVMFVWLHQNHLRLNDAIGSVLVPLSVGSWGKFTFIFAEGFALFAFASWFILRWIRRMYEQKKISDQTLTLDATMILFGFWYAIIFSGPDIVLPMLSSRDEFQILLSFLRVLAAFSIYKVIAKVALKGLNLGAGTTREMRLLLLRVYSRGKRSERLFDELASHWRYVGSIWFIAGPDLAASTVAPHEFLDFVSGKLARRFIEQPSTLELRLSESDVERDRDGRYRVNDFFCYDDTWKMVFLSLVGQIDAVLMDLRGFSPSHAGCIFEIEELINVVSLRRVVFMIDRTTDQEFLRKTMQQSWRAINPTSPNRLTPPEQVNLFQFSGKMGSDIRELLHVLCLAIEPSTGSETAEGLATNRS